MSSHNVRVIFGGEQHTLRVTMRKQAIATLSVIHAGYYDSLSEGGRVLVDLCQHFTYRKRHTDTDTVEKYIASLTDFVAVLRTVQDAVSNMPGDEEDLADTMPAIPHMDAKRLEILRGLPASTEDAALCPRRDVPTSQMTLLVRSGLVECQAATRGPRRYRRTRAGDVALELASALRAGQAAKQTPA